jgi:hypothetical protein
MTTRSGRPARCNFVLPGNELCAMRLNVDQA